MSARFHPYLCGRNAAEWLIYMENMMPYLSRYLGHKTIDETHYYYHLAAAATDIIRNQDALSNKVIPEVTDYEEI